MIKQYSTMKGTLSLHITRSPNRWHAESIVAWNGGNANHTHSGYSTLASTLWNCLDPLEHDVTLVDLTLKGKPLDHNKAYSIILKDLQDSVLAYKLPVYRLILGVSNR